MKTKYFKFVGLNIDEHLSWEFHLTITKTKLSFASHQISKVKNVFKKETLLLIYNCLFKPHLEYAIAAWGGIPKSKLNGLINIQKRCVRNIAGKKSRSHTDPIFKDLGILKLKDLFELNCAVIMYDIVYKHEFNNLGGIFQLSHSTRTKNIILESCKKEFLKHFPTWWLPRIWNEYPNDLKQLSTKNSFKHVIYCMLTSKYIENPKKCKNLTCPDCY